MQNPPETTGIFCHVLILAATALGWPAIGKAEMTVDVDPPTLAPMKVTGGPSPVPSESAFTGRAQCAQFWRRLSDRFRLAVDVTGS